MNSRLKKGAASVETVRTRMRSGSENWHPGGSRLSTGLHAIAAVALGTVVFLAHAGDAVGAIALVKNVATGGTTTTSTATAISVPAGGVAAGNTLIVSFAMDPTTGTVSCGDSRGNTYAKDVDVANGTVLAGVRTVVCSAPVTVALLAGDLVTVTHPAAAAKAISVTEFSGVGAFDKTNSATGTNTTPSSAFTVLTSQADELVIGAIGVETDSTEAFFPDIGQTALTAGSSSAAGGPTNVTINGEFRIVSARGSYAEGGTLAASRLWGAATATYRDLCGNAVVDAGEACDKGAANSACCSATCSLTAASTVCRPAAAACDAAEICSGASASCPADGFQPAVTVCRAATDLCDATESCTGASTVCPADGVLAVGSICRTATDVCDANETCTGASAACPVDGVQPAGVVCRAVSDSCDVTETCSGASAVCPADASSPGCSGAGPGIAFIKRVGSGGDTTTSTATAITVPAGGVAAGNTLIVSFVMDPAAGTVSGGDSRGNVYSKDADVSNGTTTAGIRTVIFSAPITVPLVAGDTITVAHPAVAAKAIGVNEFAGLGAFDRTASATGTNTTPSSGFTAVTNQSDELLIGTIGVETHATDAFTTGAGYTALLPGFSGSAAGPTSNVAARSEFRIVAAKGSYAASGTIDPARLWAAAIATYRGRCGNGVIDGGEPCDKSVANSACCSATCSLEAASTVCRAAAGGCDAADSCTGASASCPADGFQPAVTVCRAASDLCDATESCTGASAVCPADTLQAASTVCRAATGACDAAESCSGASASCPADDVQPAGTVCRPEADACDLLEQCSGASATCPPDLWNTGCSGPGPGIAFVRTVGVGGNTSVSTATSITVPATGVSAGNTLIVTFAMDPATGTVSCGDARGNAYTKDADLANGTVTAGVRTVVCSGRVAVPLVAGDTITVTHPAIAAKAISVNEFAGLGLPDRTASTTGANTLPTSGFALLTSQADELLIGAVGVETLGTDPFAAGAGFAALPPGTSSATGSAISNVTIRPEFGIVTAAGAFAATGTINPSRLWSTAIVTYRAMCGNGILDTGEPCDKAAATSACCSTTCQFEVAATVCRAATDLCDQAETCGGSSAACPVDARRPAGSVCRIVADLCDAAEICSGNSSACPADVLAAAGTVCRPASDLCDTTDTCTGASAACPADALAAPGAVCRAKADTCDLVDTCTGGSSACPPDAPIPGCTGPAPGIAFIKHVGSGGDTTLGTSAAIAVPAAGVAAGNTLIVTVAMDPASGTVSCGDSQGNVYTQDADVPNGTGTAGVRTVVFSAPMTTALGAGDTVSVSFPTVAAKGVSVDEFAGLAPSPGLDRSALAIGTSTTPSSGFTAATSQASELLIGAIGAETESTQPLVAGPSYTALIAGSSGSAGAPGSNVTIVPEFRVVAATGSFAAGATLQVPRAWAVALVTYGAAAAPGATVTPTPTATTTPEASATPTITPAATPSPTPTVSPGALVIDSFHCFTVKASKGAAKFAPQSGIHLVTDFDDVSVDVPAPGTLCAPTDTDGGGIDDAATHLERYQIKVEQGTPKHVRRIGLRVDNQLGTIFLDTVKPDSLLVPTAMDLAVSPPPPDPQQHQVDHYECYSVKTTRGAPRFPKGLQITTVGDAFTPSARRYLAKKPTRLCTPADTNGEGRRNPDHLLCYHVKATTYRCADGAPVNPGGGCEREADCGGTKGTTSFCVRQGRFASVSNVRTANQFGTEQVDVPREDEICLPSLRTP